MTHDATIRRKVADGLLPCEPCQLLWAGSGTGQMCVACDRAITNDAKQYECDKPDGTVTYFHLGCYLVWEAACREVGSARATPQ